MINFDVLLNKLGSFGTYQIVIFSAIIYYQIPAGLNSIASVFISYSPEYRCEMPFDGSYPNNLTYDEKMNLTTPVNDDKDPIDGCVRYDYNVTECELAGDLSCVEMDIDKTIPCENYYFDDSIFTETVVTEFELICENSFLNTVGSMVYWIGVLLGALLGGNIMDRIGRKVTIAVTAYGFLVCMLGTAYSNSAGLFFFVRFATAMFLSACNIGIFTYIMEMVGSSWRTFVGIGYQIGFAIGYMLWTPIARNYRNWQQMQLGALVLSSPFAFIVLVIPESARWLFAGGKDRKGKEIVQLMERFNKVTIDEATWLEAEESGKENLNESQGEQKYSTADLFRYKGITKVSLAIAFSWFANGIVYYGISLNAGSLAGDIFLNNIYAGIFEIVSYVICILIMDRVGRRLLLSVTFTGAGVTLLAATIVNEYSRNDQALITLGLTFSFMSKAFISASFAVVYNFTGELYPTVVRGCGVGFGSVCARVGSILAPAVIQLDQFASWLPNSLLGTLGIVGGVIALWFRDTTGMPMMETIEEAEAFYTNKKTKNSDLDLVTYEKEVDKSDEEFANLGSAL